MQENFAAISWLEARRAMLTQRKLCPDNAHSNCLEAFISPEQLEITCRCIKTFYRGLRWADEFGIQGGYVGNRTFKRVFLIDDPLILGVFDNRNVAQIKSRTPLANPTGLEELINSHDHGQGNIKTLIVLEKENLRLANSEAQGRQSQFLVDVVYPAILGIQAKLFGKSKNDEDQQNFLKDLKFNESSDDALGCLLTTDLMADVYRNPAKANAVLIDHSPLRFFYLEKSLLNQDFDQSQASVVCSGGVDELSQRDIKYR